MQSSKKKDLQKLMNQTLEWPPKVFNNILFKYDSNFYNYIKDIYEKKGIRTCCRKTFISRIKNKIRVDKAIRIGCIPSKESLNKKFNYLTVIKLTDKDKYNNQKVIAKCICGLEKEYYLNSIRRGDTKSCGCMRRSILSVVNSYRSYLFFLKDGLKETNPIITYDFLSC